jgi:hypothetical protein
VSRWLIVATLGLAITAARPAAASNETEAKDLFERAKELRKQGDCGSAVPLFRRAWQIYPKALGPLRGVADCEEQLGHFASSRRAWLEMRRALVTLPPNDNYAGWEKDAEEAAARLKEKVATFIVDVYIRSAEGEALANERSGVELFVNGESIGTKLVGTPLDQDPGTYLIRAQAPGTKPVEQSVWLAAGDHPRLTIRLTREDLPEKPVTKEHSGRRTAGFVVAGIGGAALVGSFVTFLIRQGAESDVDDACASHTNCPESLRDTVDRGKMASTLTSILLPVGVVGLGTGITLIATSGKSKTAARDLRVGASGTSITLGGRF